MTTSRPRTESQRDRSALAMLALRYLVRHGESAWSASGKHTGRTDIPLTEEGERKARGLLERLKGVGFDRVFTSPLQRGARTCALSLLEAVRRRPLHLHPRPRKGRRPEAFTKVDRRQQARELSERCSQRSSVPGPPTRGRPRLSDRRSATRANTVVDPVILLLDGAVERRRKFSPRHYGGTRRCWLTAQ